MPVSIHATELPLFKIFSNDFAFAIPPYQRPYSWTTEQASDLYSDIFFACNGEGDIKDANPYFLGSIVLIKGDTPDADVVDGQQRLTTITIFLSVLRKFVPSDFAKGLTKFLYEEGDVIVNSPNRYRVKLRSRDEEFFRRYIQDEQGLVKLLELDTSRLTDSQNNMQANAKYFHDKLSTVSPEQRVRLLQYMMTRCYLVVVSTPDIDAAYRIFTVMNARGLDLKLPDLLKAEIIGAIDEQQQEKYTQIWESEEEDLGRDAFQELFAHIRMIYQRAKLRASAMKEFRESIRPQEFPTKFIDEVLKPYSDAFEIIKKASYKSEKDAIKINALFRWLNQIDNFDWVPPAIIYFSANSQNPDKLLKFLTDLERLAAGMMIKRADINERIERYALLLSAIDNKIDLYAADSPLRLTPTEQKQIVGVLDGDLYLITRIRQYVLLRLDAALSTGEATYDHQIISVEHVLPQNPSEASVWLQWFPTQSEREKYVHRIGNLVLLSRRKNAQAQNYDFATKKEKYFKTSDGVSPFALTTQVLVHDSWTPTIIEQRQKEQIQKLKEIWRLQ